MIIGSRVREERLKRGLSQEELGKLIGVSKVAISHYERGIEQPKINNLRKLIEILEITPNYILGNDIDIICESDEVYHLRISKLELEILKQLREHQKLYNKLCDEPKRTLDLIELKLKKENML